jgi:cytochrome b6-f complex iron-sulfur subunit
MEENPHPNGEVNSQPPEVSRRRFLYYLLGFSVVATAAGVLTPVIGYIWPPSRAAAGEGAQVEVGKSSDFPAGTGKVVPVNDKPVIVVNTTKGGLKAYSAICTHFGCIVAWDQPRQFILCPCHDGRFNPVNGAVISGPPPAPLPELAVTVEGDTVYVNSGTA